jgi:hypothetical protein
MPTAGKAAVHRPVVHVSFECGEGGVERAHESLVAPDLRLQPLAVGAQARNTVELGRAQHLTNLLQWKSEFRVEENSLQAQQLVAAVVAISIRAHAGGFQQADLVIVVQRPG